MTRDFTTKEQFNAEWGELSLDKKVERIHRIVEPHMYRRPPAPRATPADDLWDPSPVTDTDFLTERFKLLTRGCWADDPKQYAEESADYLLDVGQNLPRRYLDEAGRIIERDSGNDLTALVESRVARRKARAAYNKADSPYEWERDEEELDALWEAYQDACERAAVLSGRKRTKRVPRPEREEEPTHTVRSKQHVFG